MHEPANVPLAVAGPIRDLAVSRATFVLHADGTMESWGANPPLARPSPLFPDPYAQPVSIPKTSNLDLADDNACAAAGGIGYCWGSVLPNFAEHTPTAPDLTNTLPEAVSTPEPVVQIATTVNVVKYELGTPIAQRQRWCAIGLSGAVYCWGPNTSGQAGDGTKAHAYEAVKVVGLPAPAAQVKTAPDSTCALLTSGKVYCWGSNYYGQLGNRNIRQPNSAPQEVVMP
jgi:alpha-tubulin suppressor-like RCC1 family protein